MSIPDIPAVPEVSGESKSGLKYRIMGTVQQTLILDLKPGRVVFSDTGAMSWMTSTITMDTHSGGGLTGMFKRAITGASMFVIDFSAEGAAGQVAFSTDFPGKILAFELDKDQSILMHKHAFICAEKSVTLDIAVAQKIGTGFFGGIGFVMQSLIGPGMVFAELDGDAIEYHLKPGETLRVEPGHVAMFESSVIFDVEMIKGLNNIIAGGEGLFLATLTGPGRVWLHSLTVSKMAERLMISNK